MTPFWLPKLIAILAGAVFVFASDASRWAKLTVSGVVLLSLVLQHGFGSIAAWTVGLVLQVAAAVGVLVYFKVPR